ncbi:vacuolar protein sorting-associated protein 28 homolog [Paramacrobiotus metropolitanus]|uniref:vacuolar protein sorting-associated protein 28 homolog n=1 Tax=Paramacrobiotus metropolitanus TaxID=2943436 RepID=UPI0024458055|nr:vacuolar protein sorting-associated protein 28 homolog [Paramacrobiotus metropolitanus]
MALFTNLQSPPGYDMGSGNNNPALMETVRLYKNSKERDWYENMSDLYAVINSIEQLEKAYIRDCITSKEYTAACSKLLVQVKSAFKLIKSEEFPTIEAFMEKFRFDCPAAMERIRDDSPITIRDDKGNTSKCIADIVALFITVMDKLRLQMKAVDEIQPEMRDLMDTINRLSILPADYEGRAAVSKWLHVMSSMNASEEFDDGQIRQMIFDLESGYSALLKLLHSTS